MGSCAKLWAIEPGAFARLRAIPSPGPEQDACEAAEAIAWAYDPAVVLARWQDGADNDLSRIAAGEARELARLLGLAGTRPALPWWVSALWPRDGNEVGLVAPDELAALRVAVREARTFALLGPRLRGLERFLEQADAAGCYIVGVEGRS